MKLKSCHQPFLLPPNRVFRNYLGGKVLDEIEGKPGPRDSNFPEDWIGSATRAINPGREHLEEGIGTALTADGKEIRIDELIKAGPQAVLGDTHVKAFGTGPQLLVKYLDASIRLHMQAHPSVEWSLRYLNDDKGKTEAWWVLGSRMPNPYVYFAFQRPPSAEEWGRMIKEQDTAAMLDCFDKIPVSPGDVLLIKGGIPHAIGEGLFVLEIMEPTDYVVKTEWDIGGIKLTEEAATMGRGTENILDIFDYTAYPKKMVKEYFGPCPRTAVLTETGREETLLEAPQTDRVEVRRLRTTGPFRPETDGRFSILIVVDGRGSVRAGGAGVEVQRWSKVLIPACVDDLEIDGTLHLARCMPPKP